MPVSPAQVAEALNPRSLYLILLPTEQCNFRCTYCYEKFDIGRMSRRVVTAVCRFLERRLPELDRFEIGWFGGEPLLAKDVIQEIMTHASRLSGENPGLAYAANMTTNAYLLDKSTAETYFGLGLDSYQISLDGPAAVHDTLRRRRDSGNTFERIWSNLLALRDSDLALHVTLRIHFTADTLSQLNPLIADVNREFADDSRFCVYFKAIEHLGGPNDDSIRLVSRDSIAETSALLGAKLANPRQAASLDKAGPYICYASKPNSLVVRANGGVAKCTVAFDDPRNRLGVINSDGTLAIDQNQMRLWLRGFPTLDEDALACPLSAMNRARKLGAPQVRVRMPSPLLWLR